VGKSSNEKGWEDWSNAHVFKILGDTPAIASTFKALPAFPKGFIILNPSKIRRFTTWVSSMDGPVQIGVENQDGTNWIVSTISSKRCSKFQAVPDYKYKCTTRSVVDIGSKDLGDKKTWWYRAQEFNGSWSNWSEGADFIIKSKEQLRAQDNQPPTAPTELKIVSESIRHVSLQWRYSFDNIGIRAYKIFRNGTQLLPRDHPYSYSYYSSIKPYFVDRTVKAGKSYTYSIVAVDYAGNESSSSIRINVDSSDTTAPKKPRVSTRGSFTIKGSDGLYVSRLTHFGSKDDSEFPKTYNVYQDGKFLKATTTDKNRRGGNIIHVNKLSPNTTYTFHITAVDAAGNESEKSAPITVVTRN
jgi:hypothetical protein